MLDHRADDREGGQRARVDRARGRLGAVGISRAAAVRAPGRRSFGPRPDASRYPAAASLRKNQRSGTSARGGDSRGAPRPLGRDAPREVLLERRASWTSRRTESIVNRSKCSAQRMNSGVKSERIAGSGMRASSVSRSSVRAVTPAILALPRRADSVHCRAPHEANPRVPRRSFCWASPPLAAAEAPGRVVILGFDGVDAAVVEEMLARGQLPNLAALKARGGYSPLTPTVPAQTPVSWATFSTGLDPGGHEIFDFLKRDPANRIPTFAVAEEKSVPLLSGKEAIPRRSRPRRWRSFCLPRAPALRSAPARRPARSSRSSASPRRAGAFLAVRAWLPDDAALGQEQPPRARVLGGGRRAPGDGHPDARDLSAGGLRGRPDALGPRRARPLRPDRKARLLHVGPVLRAARGQRLLGRDRPARVERRPPAGHADRRARPAGPSDATARSTPR